MPVLSGLDLIKKVSLNQIAVPSFDVAGGNLDMLDAVCAKLKQFSAGAFLASTPGSIKDYFGFTHFVRSIRDVSEKYDVNVAIHLDHATSITDINEALNSGFSSVMYDGSRLPIDKNIEMTCQVVKKAHEIGVSVEAELGIVGGKEDEVEADACKFPTHEESIQFVSKTGVDLFAPAIGTTHGNYTRQPDIQWDLLKLLATDFPTPLVLHGGTGLVISTLHDILKHGFVKVNYATGIRSAFKTGILEGIGNSLSVKPQQYLKTGRERVAEFTELVLKIVMRNDCSQTEMNII